jgi:hypothetical protein
MDTEVAKRERLVQVQAKVTPHLKASIERLNVQEVIRSESRVAHTLMFFGMAEYLRHFRGNFKEMMRIAERPDPAAFLEDSGGIAAVAEAEPQYKSPPPKNARRRR